MASKCYNLNVQLHLPDYSAHTLKYYAIPTTIYIGKIIASVYYLSCDSYLGIWGTV